MKRLITIPLALFLTAGAFAQDTEMKTTFLDDPMLPYYIGFGVLVVLALLVVAVAIYVISILNMLSEQAEKANAEKLGVPYVSRATWWSRIKQQLNASVPLEQEKDIVMDHDYDGIRELDNHLPPWWKWLFYATIVFSGFYIVFYHFSDTLPLQEEEYLTEMKAADALKAKMPSDIDEATLTFINDPAMIENGKAVFASACIACHRGDGGGINGPNLTDAYWIHGGDVKEIFATVKNGVVDKGMPAWGKAMSPKDVRDVVFFVMSLQGSNPPGAKAPQGELVQPGKVAADSTVSVAFR